MNKLDQLNVLLKAYCDKNNINFGTMEHTTYVLRAAPSTESIERILNSENPEVKFKNSMKFLIRNMIRSMENKTKGQIAFSPISFISYSNEDGSVSENLYVFRLVGKE